MPNPLLNNIAFNNNSNEGMYLLSALKNIKNPQSFINNIVLQNPQAKAFLNQIQKSNISPKDYALQLLKKQGINVNDFINMMNQNGIKL